MYLELITLGTSHQTWGKGFGHYIWTNSSRGMHLKRLHCAICWPTDVTRRRHHSLFGLCWIHRSCLINSGWASSPSSGKGRCKIIADNGTCVTNFFKTIDEEELFGEHYLPSLGDSVLPLEFSVGWWGNFTACSLLIFEPFSAFAALNSYTTSHSCPVSLFTRCHCDKRPLAVLIDM